MAFYMDVSVRNILHPITNVLQKDEIVETLEFFDIFI